MTLDDDGISLRFKPQTRKVYQMLSQSSSEACIQTVEYLVHVVEQNNALVIQKLEARLDLWHSEVEDTLSDESLDYEHLFHALVNGGDVQPGNATDLLALLEDFKRTSKRKVNAYGIVDRLATEKNWWEIGEKERLVAFHFVFCALDSGSHEYVTLDNVKKAIAKPAKNDDVGRDVLPQVSAQLANHVYRLAQHGALVRIGGKLFTTPRIYETSRVIATVLRRSKTMGAPSCDVVDPPAELSSEQQRVFDRIVNKNARLTYVAAKGGRGKSKTADHCAKEFETVFCLAPTHKALETMREWVGDAAIDERGVVTHEDTTYVFMTVHSFHYRFTKKWREGCDDEVIFGRKHDSQTEIPEPELIIVDELSMLAGWMVRSVLEFANHLGVPVAGFGDAGQLPNVGDFGSPIDDLDEFDGVRLDLTINFRVRGRELSAFADGVSKGELVVPDDPDQVRLRFCAEDDVALAHVEDLYREFSKDGEALVTKNPFNADFLQVIAPLHATKTKVNALGQRLYGTDAAKTCFGEPVEGGWCCIGDPVVFQDNTPGYKQGQIGVLLEVYKPEFREMARVEGRLDAAKRRRVVRSRRNVFEFDEAMRRIPAAKRRRMTEPRSAQPAILYAKVRTKKGHVVVVADMKDILPAYAITTHSSQSSQYKRVAVLMHAETRAYGSLLTRKMLYTAVSRAQEFVCFIGREENLRECINKPGTRRSIMRYVIAELDEEQQRRERAVATEMVLDTDDFLGDVAED